MMNFDKIEQAYALLLENTQTLQNHLHTHAYDALIEQNALYLSGKTDDGLLARNHQTLRNLNLMPKEWQKVFQFLLIKLAQTEPLQANHQFTPDLIGFIILFLLEELSKGESLSVLELGSGTGNLAQTLLSYASKSLTYLGIELDDLLLDLAASTAEVMGSPAQFIQGDAVRPHFLQESDVIISDLPVGYYPNDEIASRYQVASQTEHTYVHHLLMEQSLKYLKADGLAIFLAPSHLLTSQQSSLLKAWMTESASLLALISLPDNLFAREEQAKSLFIFKKSLAARPDTFVYPLSDLKNPTVLQDFMENLKKWKQEANI